MWNSGGIALTGEKPKDSEKKPVPVPLCKPQIIDE
jgi:hypothetical protein